MTAGSSKKSRPTPASQRMAVARTSRSEGDRRCGRPEARPRRGTRRPPKESSCQPRTRDASHHSDRSRHSPVDGCTLRRLPCGAKEGTTCVFPVDISRRPGESLRVLGSATARLRPGRRARLRRVRRCASCCPSRRRGRRRATPTPPTRGPPPPDRPWVVLNMIASVDGATAVAGRSGGLGGPADRSRVHRPAGAGRRHPGGRRHGAGRALRAAPHRPSRAGPPPGPGPGAVPPPGRGERAPRPGPGRAAVHRVARAARS